MKLKIQLFAEETVSYDTAALTEAKEELNSIQNDVLSAMETVVQQMTEVTETNTDQETQNQMQEVTSEINNDKDRLAEAFTGLSTVISAALEIFSENKNQFTSEIQAWIESFKSTIDGVKQGYTAEGATQGAETVKSSLQGIADSGIKISGYTRGIVTETVNIIKNSGNLVKGVTGSSPQELVNQSVGTIKTLLTNNAANPDGSIIRSLGNRLGSALAAFLNSGTTA